MSEYDGEVQLGVKLKPEDVQKSATKLAKSVESIFNANAGKEMNSSFKRVLATLDKNISKGRELNKTLDELRNKKVYTDEYARLLEKDKEISKEITKINAQMTEMEKLGNTDKPMYRSLVRDAERLNAELDKVIAKETDLKQAGLDMKVDPSVAGEIDKVTQKLNENNNAIRVDISKFDEMAAKSGTVVSSMNAVGNSVEQLSPELAQLGDNIVKTTQQMMSSSATPNFTKEVQDMGTYAERASKQWSNSLGIIKQSIQDIPNLIKGIPAAAASGFEALRNHFRINASSARDMRNELEKANKSVQKVSASTVSASKNVKALGKNMKSASSSASGFDLNLGKIFKKILMYGFGIRSVYILVRKLRQAIIEGLKSMAQMNNGANETNRAISQLSTSFFAFKNSIAAAVAPLVNLLAPALARIVDLCTQAMNAIASFIAALTGKSSFMKATKVQQNFAGSLDKTAGSAKKAKKELQQLAGFDELNVLNSKDEDSGGGGGAGAKPAFEEVKIDPKILDWVNKLKDAWAKIVDYLKQLKDAFMSGFWEGLGDWESRVARLKQGLDDIWTALKDIWSDPEVLSAADKWAKSVAHLFGALAGSMVSIGLTIATNLIAGLGNYLRDNTDRIKQYLIDIFNIRAEINDLLATLFIDIAYIFEAFASENGIRITAALIGIFADAFMGVSELVSKAMRDIINLIVEPLHRNKETIRKALEDTFGYIADIFETLKEDIDYVFDEINKSYDEHLKPLFDDLASDISNIVAKFMGAYNTYFKPVWNNIVKSVKEFSNTYFKPMIDSIINFLNPVIDIIRLLWNNILQPYLMWFVDKFVAMIANKLQFLGDVIKTVASIVTTIITDVLSVLGNLLQFIVDVFTVGWNQAWENLKDNFVRTWETMKSQLEGIVNNIIDMINSMLRSIGGGINNLLEGFNKIKSWVGDHGGPKSAPFDLISIPHIPRLAQGAVIPPNKEFMAVLGDQTSGTNIETPLSTMIEAFNAAKGDEEALLREQNEILRELLYKEWKLDPKDVFNATREQNKDFIRRTGKSAFAY